jgi:hypothetical protein
VYRASTGNLQFYPDDKPCESEHVALMNAKTLPVLTVFSLYIYYAKTQRDVTLQIYTASVMQGF